MPDDQWLITELIWEKYVVKFRPNENPPSSLWKLCRNVENSMFVILNPSPPVILSPSPVVILSEAKDLDVRLRVNSVKNLRESISYKTEILRLTPQNDVTTHPL